MTRLAKVQPAVGCLPIVRHKEPRRRPDWLMVSLQQKDLRLVLEVADQADWATGTSSVFNLYRTLDEWP